MKHKVAGVTLTNVPPQADNDSDSGGVRFFSGHSLLHLVGVAARIKIAFAQLFAEKFIRVLCCFMRDVRGTSIFPCLPPARSPEPESWDVSRTQSFRRKGVRG